MTENSSEVLKDLKEEKSTISKKISIALEAELAGPWSKEDQFDYPTITEAMSKYLKVDDKGNLSHPKWIVSVRNPHLYSILIDLAYHKFHKRHGSVLEPNALASKKKARIAEEILHGVPTLGERAITDRIYCVAFLYDVKTTKHIIHPFFIYNDLTDNYALLLDVAGAPHVVLGTHEKGIDKTLTNLASEKLNK